jgi:hypothetical protein
MDNLLPVEAIEWMIAMGYREASHEERMTLIAEAKEIFS